MDGGMIVMGKITKKGKVNGLEVLDGLTKLGTMVLNVVHVVHK